MVTDTRRWARIHWVDTHTKATGVYTDSPGCPSMHYDGGGEFSTWWWAEGNGSCGCNRSIYFLGTPLDDAECSDGRFSIKRLEVVDSDGAVIKAYENFDATFKDITEVSIPPEPVEFAWDVKAHERRIEAW